MNLLYTIKRQTLWTMWVIWGIALMGVSHAANPKNIIFVTIDDLNRDSLGIYGSTVANISPNLDALALSGLRFNHAHVAAANCTPSRNVIVSGKYSHKNKVLSVSNEGSGNHNSFPLMPDVFREAGYHTGIMGKNSHMLPFHPYLGWDKEYDSYGSTRDPENIYNKLTTAIADAASMGKPLFFNLNIYDPHVSWHNWDHRAGKPKVTGDPDPSHVYTGAEVPYPSFMPPLTAAEMEFSDTPYDVMDEIAAYYNNVKRADDSIGRMMDAINDAGIGNNTIIVLISDHGVELPGAKTQVYHHSSVSPMFVVWPGVTNAGDIDNTHMINSVDFLPSFCDLIGQPIPADVDGKSFIPIIQGQDPSDWPDHIYKQHSVGHNMRAVETTELLYIFNPWSDGVRKPTSVTTGHKCFEAIELAAAGGNTEAAAWLQKFNYRTVEELYDTSIDPDCANNLLDDPAYATKLTTMRNLMAKVMLETDDLKMLTAFNDRVTQSTLDQYIEDDEVMRTAMKRSPTYTRDVFFNPHDDWVEFNSTLFEPFGNWGGWQAETSGIILNATEGNKASGNSAVEFDGSVANISRLLLPGIIDTSAYNQLKLDAIITDDGTAFSGGATLSLQYDDGGGAGWQTFQTISSADPYNLILELPGGGLPESMRFSIAVDLNGTGGSIYMDYVRFTAWQDWASAPTDAPFDATNHKTVRLKFDFIAQNFTASDKLLLEYYNGVAWAPVKEYDFSYALLSGTRYTDRIDMEDSEYTFSDRLEFRFRSESTGAGQSFTLNNYTINTRKASNRGPLASDDSYSEADPKAIVVAAPGILENDTTGGRGALHAELISGTSHGILELYTDGSFVYAPINGYTGNDSFTYRAVNEENSNTATVWLTINSATVPNSGILPFSDDFETATATGQSGSPDPAKGWVHSGATSFGSSDGVGGSVGVRMRNNNSLMTKAIDTTGYTDITIVFQGKSEALTSAAEEMAVQWSADGGSTWITLDTVPYTVTNYQEFSFTFPSAAENNPNFAFRFQGNAPKNTTRGYFDDVVVSGSSPAAPPITTQAEWAATHGVLANNETLIDYAFNINPHLSQKYWMTITGNSGLPIWDYSETNNDRITIQFIRRKQTTDLIYRVQFTSDLTGVWMNATEPELITPIDDEFEQVSIRDNVTLSEVTRRFARVYIQKIP